MAQKGMFLLGRRWGRNWNGETVGSGPRDFNASLGELDRSNKIFLGKHVSKQVKRESHAVQPWALHGQGLAGVCTAHGVPRGVLISLAVRGA